MLICVLPDIMVQGMGRKHAEGSVGGCEDLHATAQRLGEASAKVQEHVARRTLGRLPVFSTVRDREKPVASTGPAEHTRKFAAIYVRRHKGVR